MRQAIPLVHQLHLDKQELKIVWHHLLGNAQDHDGDGRSVALLSVRIGAQADAAPALSSERKF